MGTEAVFWGLIKKYLSFRGLHTCTCNSWCIRFQKQCDLLRRKKKRHLHACRHSHHSFSLRQTCCSDACGSRLGYIPVHVRSPIHIYIIDFLPRGILGKPWVSRCGFCLFSEWGCFEICRTYYNMPHVTQFGVKWCIKNMGSPVFTRNLLQQKKKKKKKLKLGFWCVKILCKWTISLPWVCFV